MSEEIFKLTVTQKRTQINTSCVKKKERERHLLSTVSSQEESSSTADEGRSGAWKLHFIYHFSSSSVLSSDVYCQ